MSRFAEPQDPVFRALNTSLPFDRRLWPEDLAQSRAHAEMLAAQGIIGSDDRDAAILALRERGVASKPYLPAIHLMSYYRETFGHREGEFPVCEDVAARSLALPFFPQIEPGDQELVVEALRDALVGV